VFPAHFNRCGAHLVPGKDPGGSSGHFGENQRHILDAAGFDTGGDPGAFEALRHMDVGVHFSVPDLWMRLEDYSDAPANGRLDSRISE
jgi:hypothetical protein